ncbi:hypothetical protein ACH24_03140 [Francisella persica ATCC VR-331]|uniref:Uncharacterized protein n=1 Tax=Francisella persica ATCC VR-331 TaxID=1086726 RepID=A0AAC9EUC3_9GAMM|nr:hypothetical protein [Francisella persica]ALB01712.1 hypothetical protein ACH24_03140 [Francisella persica ATCC VR-331]ANH78010.1 hypothetical protein FSC845_05955 [Francisella persica ATCC VR-331]
MKKFLKIIIENINMPLVIFLMLVGTLLLVANMRIKPIKAAKETVNQAVNNVSKTLNNAAKSNSTTV